jgi:hypothetical protein
MQFTKKILSTILLFSFYSCGDFWASNYDFETTAIYVAPKTRATAIVLTKGYVPKGADLGDENECLISARITFGDKPAYVLKIKSNGFKVLATTINDTTFQFKDSTNYALILMETSRKLGMTNVDSTELAELGQAILNTGAGPKGTFLKGQTKQIIVDTVRYTTKDR